MRKTHISSILMTGVAIILLASGCGGSSTSPGYGGGNTGGNNTGGGTPSQVTIAGMAFGSLTVAKGTVVTWKNNDTMPHSATADNSSAFAFDTGMIGPGGTSAGITFSQAGTFAYHCTVHPSMHGSITVQ